VAEVVVWVIGVTLSALLLWVMWQYYINGNEGHLCGFRAPG
jgi:hypothetical protein